MLFFIRSRNRNRIRSFFCTISGLFYYRLFLNFILCSSAFLRLSEIKFGILFISFKFFISTDTVERILECFLFFFIKIVNRFGFRCKSIIKIVRNEFFLRLNLLHIRLICSGRTNIEYTLNKFGCTNIF